MRKSTPPTNPFSIPKYVAPSVSNAALEVTAVYADGTFDARVYDPLGVSDLTHGDVVVRDVADTWIAVELNPVLFTAKS